MPWPGWLSTAMAPSCFWMMPCTTLKPRPVPCPTGLVVKKGSKTLVSCSGGMPVPVSATSIRGPSSALVVITWTSTGSWIKR